MTSENRNEENQVLLGFLFGNIDENNKVEADYLDEVGILVGAINLIFLQILTLILHVLCRMLENN